MEPSNINTWAIVVECAPPAVTERLVRIVNFDEPPDFFEFARQQRDRAMNLGDSHGWDLLIDGQVILLAVGHPTILTARQALELAQAALKSDPLFDTKLLRRLMARGHWPEEVPAPDIMRALLVLEVLPEPSRLTMTILKFSKHPDPFVQSKVAKILGRHLDNMDVLEEFFRHADNRVRSNLVEGIGLRTKLGPLEELVHRASADQDQRISSMALAIKARCGHTASLALIRMRNRSKVESIRQPAQYATLVFLREEAVALGLAVPGSRTPPADVMPTSQGE